MTNLTARFLAAWCTQTDRVASNKIMGWCKGTGTTVFAAFQQGNCRFQLSYQNLKFNYLSLQIFVFTT